MLEKATTFIIVSFLFFSSAIADDLTGFWTTLNNKTKKPSSVIAVYLYEGSYYGRIIGTYNSEGIIDDTIYDPKDKAPGIMGNPYYSGLDIVWTTKAGKNGKYKGYVVDPEKGKTYTAKLWKQGDNLILRGEVLIFGKNVTWPPFPETSFTENFTKPDLSTFVPTIPKTVH
ncbi:MAG: DUF2147 domain-containing protein [Verrucomicrobia bacterium]|nr:DUF2147 domain-containing protein [Verrucomicrobiota bacterium]